MAFVDPVNGLYKALQLCGVLDHRMDKIPQGLDICPTTVTIERMHLQQRRVPALADNDMAQYFLGCIHSSAELQRAVKIKTHLDRMNDDQKKSFAFFVENLAAEIDQAKTISPYKAFASLEAELTKRIYLFSTKQQPALNKANAYQVA